MQAEEIIICSYWQLVCDLVYGQEQYLIFSECLERFLIFPYSYLLDERRKIPKCFGLMECGF